VTESKTPRVSIVTPTLNQAPYIETTIRSVLDQEYPDLEYIVIDGGSEDGTQELIRRYEDRLKYWVSEPDRGQGHALNKGFEHASGELLAYINSDDYYLPGAVAAIVELARRNPEAGLFHGRCRFVSEDGCGEGSHFGSISTLDEVLDLWDVWWAGRQMIQPEVFWTRQLAERVGPFREDVYFGMDYDFWCRCLAAGAAVARVDQEVCCFRFSPAQKTSARNAVAEELLAIAGDHLWDRSIPLTGRRRRDLKAKWLYQRRLLPVLTRSAAAGEGRLARWLRALAVVARHPTLWRSPRLRQRLSQSLRRGRSWPHES
jgi:glycosyltransferase involved in cell wall biosynthesis